jgi:hypothetical protein
MKTHYVVITLTDWTNADVQLIRATPKHLKDQVEVSVNGAAYVRVVPPAPSTALRRYRYRARHRHRHASFRRAVWRAYWCYYRRGLSYWPTIKY